MTLKPKKKLKPATIKGTTNPHKSTVPKSFDLANFIHKTPRKLLVVGFYPDVVEVKHQEHFLSKRGERLLKSLAILGYTKDDINYVNIIPYTLPNIWSTISLAEYKVRLELLRRIIKSCDPILIVACGDYAAKALTVATNSEKYRGSVLKCKLDSRYKVLIVRDQFDVNISPKLNYANNYDFRRILPNLESRDLIRKKLTINIEENLDVFQSEFLNEDYIRDPDSWLSFDIECIGSDLVCIGFSKDPNTAWVMPLHDFRISKFCTALRLIDRILRSPVRKVAQNGNFDIFYLGYYYKIKCNNFYFDTMLAQHSLYSNTPKGLDFLASIYTNEPYWKDEGKQWKAKNINWQEFYEYNGKDAANTLEIALAQIPLLHARDVVSTFKRSMGLCYPIITMEMAGVKIEKSLQGELGAENDEIYRKLELLLHEIVGFPLNIKSHKQVKEYLYGTLKLPKKYKDGKLTSGNDALLALVAKGGPVVKLIILMRDYAKRGTFYAIKTTEEGRVHTTFKIGGTETGRLSSSKSILGVGSNLQNIPKRARRLYIADESCSFINADYSKAESWIVAHIANDEKMITALYGEDFHKVNASNILGIPVSEISYADRQLGKKISHACNYAVTAFTFHKVMVQEGHDITRAECQELLDKYFETYPRVRGFQAGIREQLGVNRTLINIFGRKMTYFDYWGDSLFRSAYSYIPQGSVGDMTNQGLKNIYNTIDITILLQIHDAILMQKETSLIIDELISSISDAMSFPITVNHHEFKIPVDIEVGQNWLELIPYNEWRTKHVKLG